MTNIQQLARSVTAEMEAAGYAEQTIWSLYCCAMLPLIRYHAAHGTDDFDPYLTAEYERTEKERYERGEITRGHYYHRLRGIDKIKRLYDTGKLLWEPVRVGSMYKSNDYYQQLLDEFLDSNAFHPNTRDDIVWVARSFFSWLTDNGHADLSLVTAAEIQRFIVHFSGFMASSSVRNVLMYTKKLCAYLHERGLLANPFTALLSMSVSRESKMYPAARQDEIALVLERVDRSTARGKRDYAVILLGAVTGLRAVDIRDLKLSNIYWKRGEIRIVQSKTGNTNVLPLTKDVGEAVKDYILHARPKSVDDNVFIRVYPPFVAVADSWSIGDIYDRYRNRAGLPREAFDGKGFHSLRRAVGKNMTTAGIPVTSTAQVLGDINFDSAKKYIALDSEHLAEVALDFSGIEVAGGAVR
jgi:integrase